METRANYVLVGSFVVVLLTGLVIAAFWLAQGQFSQKATFYAIFFDGSVSGLVDGSPVQINGIQVGHVTSITLDPQTPGTVQVVLAVNTTANVVIHADAVASMETQGLAGGVFVEISPGSRDAPVLQQQSDQKYPVIASKQSDMAQVFASVPDVMNKLIAVANQILVVLGDKNQVAFAATLDNVSRLTGALATHSDDFGNMISDGALTAHELSGALKSVDLGATMRNLNDTSREFATVAKKADGLVGDLDGVLKDNRQPLRQFTGAELNEAQQLMANANTLVLEVTRAVQMIERDPSLLLYGDRRQGYQPK